MRNSEAGIKKILGSRRCTMGKTHRLTQRIYANHEPNYLCHLGLEIHGCIDDYSIHNLLIQVRRSSKDPALVVKYFLDCINQLNGAPRNIRANRGVKNTVIAGIQRYSHNFENSSYLFGKLTSKQRIEARSTVFADFDESF